jgi:hypothetical protein
MCATLHTSFQLAPQCDQCRVIAINVRIVTWDSGKQNIQCLVVCHSIPLPYTDLTYYPLCHKYINTITLRQSSGQTYKITFLEDSSD